MVTEMANIVAFQPFSPSKLQYSERWSCEALREKEELHVKLKSVTNTQWILWTVLNQSKYSILFHKFLIHQRKQWQWTQKIPHCLASVSDWAPVARSSLTFKLIKVMMSAVELDVKHLWKNKKRVPWLCTFQQTIYNCTGMPFFW